MSGLHLIRRESVIGETLQRDPLRESRIPNPESRIKILISTIALLSLVIAHGASTETNGFAVKFSSADGKTSDIMVLPNLWLYVEEGKSATPFLPAGRFTAVFEGSINGDLRADYIFKAEELGGSLK